VAEPSADPALLAEVIAAEGIRVDAPEGPERWVGALLDWALARLQEADLPGPAPGPLPDWLLTAAFVTVALLLLGLGAALLRGAWALRPLPAAPPPVRRAPPPPADPAAALDAALAAGDARAATRALWLSVAGALAAQGLGSAAPDLTQQELCALVARRAPDWPGLPELRALGSAVDLLFYGPHPPGVAQVRGLLPAAHALVARLGPAGRP
jgi:hypothetical protein